MDNHDENLSSYQNKIELTLYLKYFSIEKCMYDLYECKIIFDISKKYIWVTDTMKDGSELGFGIIFWEKYIYTEMIWFSEFPNIRENLVSYDVPPLLWHKLFF